MTRDALPRAYLRIDPNIDQVYPELRSTFVGLLCAAHRQPERGRFRDRRLVEQLCGRAYVGRAFDRGDLCVLEDGRVYLLGWDEWQEGDMTVAERMRRMRDRRKRNSVTRGSSPPRSGVTTDAVAKGSTSPVVGGSDSDSPPPPAERGRRKSGTSPRQLGRSPRDTEANPRANGTSPRQERAAEKRGGIPTSVAAILRAAAEAGR
jgi:hypothetical protein